jgi:hypothetical protein
VEEIPGVVSRRTMLRLPGGEWTRVRRGRYVSTQAAAGLSPEQRHVVLAKALLPVLSPDAVFSHVSAAAVHGLPLPWRSLSQAHVTRDRRCGSGKRGQVVMHGAVLADGDVVEVDRLRVTSAARTVVDLARSLPFAEAVAAGDAALHSGAATGDEVVEQVARAVGRPGVRQAQAVVEFLDGRSEGVGESLLRVAVAQLGYRRFELQVEIFDMAGEFVARVDMALPDFGVALEFDGRVKYLAEMRDGLAVEQVVLAEKRREDLIRALGWMVVRVTWDELNDLNRLALRLRAAVAAARGGRTVGTWAAPAAA